LQPFFLFDRMPLVMRYTNTTAFLKHLREAAPHHFSRVYWIAIPDSFDRAKVLETLVKAVRGTNQVLETFHGAACDVKSVLDRLQTPSLFGGEPLLVLEEAEKLTKSQVALLEPFVSRPPLFGYFFMGAAGKSPLAAAAEKGGVILDLLEEKPWDKEKRLQEQMEKKAQSVQKRLAPSVASFLLERLGFDASMLEQELDKLFCYVGDREIVERTDVEAIGSQNRSFSAWQIAEELIWEGRLSQPIDEPLFHALLPALRTQLQTGRKIATLLEANASREEWDRALPRMFAKTLQKRSSQVSFLGGAYFARGLKALFELELQSRGDFDSWGALFDRFRGHVAHVRR
jgi:DNA polymerase-3 subunit delta